MLSYFNPKKYIQRLSKNEGNVQKENKKDLEIHSDFLRYLRRKKRYRGTNSFPFYWWKL